MQEIAREIMREVARSLPHGAWNGEAADLAHKCTNYYHHDLIAEQWQTHFDKIEILLGSIYPINLLSYGIYVRSNMPHFGFLITEEGDVYAEITQKFNLWFDQLHKYHQAGQHEKAKEGIQQLRDQLPALKKQIQAYKPKKPELKDEKLQRQVIQGLRALSAFRFILGSKEHQAIASIADAKEAMAASQTAAKDVLAVGAAGCEGMAALAFWESVARKESYTVHYCHLKPRDSKTEELNVVVLQNTGDKTSGCLLSPWEGVVKPLKLPADNLSKNLSSVLSGIYDMAHLEPMIKFTLTSTPVKQEKMQRILPAWKKADTESAIKLRQGAINLFNAYLRRNKEFYALLSTSVASCPSSMFPRNSNNGEMASEENSSRLVVGVASGPG